MEPRLIETVNGFTIRLHNAGTSSAYYLAKRESTVFTGKSLNYVRKQCQRAVKASMIDVETLSDDDLKERYGRARTRLEKAKKERASDIDIARKDWFTLQSEMKRRKFPTGKWLSMSTLYPELPANLQSMSDKELDNAYMENRRAVTRARNNLGGQDPTTRRLMKQSGKFLAEVRRRNVRGVSASNKPSRMAKVVSLRDLQSKAASDPRYEKLAIESANNLGGNAKTLQAAMRWLETNANETDERGVVREVNQVLKIMGKDLSMSRRAAYLRKKYSKNVQASSKTVAANRLAEDNARLQELLKKVPEFDRSMFKDIDSGRYPVSEVAKDLIADGASPEAANEFARFLAEKTKRYNIRHEKFVTDFDMSTSKATQLKKSQELRPGDVWVDRGKERQIVSVRRADEHTSVVDDMRRVAVFRYNEDVPIKASLMNHVARRRRHRQPTYAAAAPALVGQLVFTVAKAAAAALIADLARKIGAKAKVIGSKGASGSRVQVQFEKTPENQRVVQQVARKHKAALAMSSTDSTASTYMISWKAEEPQLLALLKQFKLKANVAQKGRHPDDEISIKVFGPKAMIKAAWRKALDKKLVSDSDVLKWSMSTSRAERYALSLAKKKTVAFSAGDPNLSRLDRACRRIMKAAQGINMDAKAEQAVAYGSDRPVSAGLVQQLEKFAEAIQILERKFPDRDSR